MDEHFLSELLPYDLSVKMHGRLSDGLREYLLLLVAAEESMRSLKAGKLRDFDPLVGENACQIRALKLAFCIRSGLLDADRLLQDVERAKARVMELLAGPLSGSLGEMLRSENLEITISCQESFLIESYILTKVKIPLPPCCKHPILKKELTDTRKIKEICEVGSMFARDFVRGLREKISVTSVRFIQKLTGCAHLGLVSDEYLVKHRGLSCLPCFATARILMEQALSHGFPIVMFVEQKDDCHQTVEKSVLFFEASRDGYVETDHVSMDPEAPALFIFGSAVAKVENKVWLRDLTDKGPMDLILAYAAAHRQYPNIEEDKRIHQAQDSEYEYYREKADEWGCSLENPSCFFLTHAFCDRVENFSLHL